MKSVIVHITSRTRKGYKTYSTLGRASAALKRMGLEEGEYTAMTLADFNAQDEDITVRSAMNGAEITIKRSQRGNPALDPSMEGYWSM